MPSTLRLAIAQMTSTDGHAGNVAWLEAAAAQAAAEEAAMLALPEAAGLMCRDPDRARPQVVGHERDPFVAACRAAAARHGIWVHTGSTPILGPQEGDGRFLKHSDLIDPDGRIVADYDKIHLFDIHLDGRAPPGESTRYAPGARDLAPSRWLFVILCGGCCLDGGAFPLWMVREVDHGRGAGGSRLSGDGGR